MIMERKRKRNESGFRLSVIEFLIFLMFPAAVGPRIAARFHRVARFQSKTGSCFFQGGSRKIRESRDETY